MRKSWMKGLTAVLAGLALISSASVCYAQDPFTKLGRGLANTLTGWVELPKNVYDTGKAESPIAGATLGLAKGVGMTLVRTGAGIFEVVTFPFPIPESYKPILEPEYVF